MNEDPLKDVLKGVDASAKEKHMAASQGGRLFLPIYLADTSLAVEGLPELRLSSARVAFELCSSRRLNAEQFAEICMFLVRCDASQVGRFLNELRCGVNFFGGNGFGFRLFFRLIASHRGLHGISHFREALIFSSPAFECLRKEEPHAFLYPHAEHSMLDVPEDILKKIQRASASLDLLASVADSGERLLSAIEQYFEKDAEAKERVIALILDIAKQTCLLDSGNEFSFGERVCLAALESASYLDIENVTQRERFLWLLHLPGLKVVFQTIAILGRFIFALSDSEKLAHLENLLRGPFGAACEAAGYPEAARETLLKSVTDELLRHSRLADGSWVSRVGTESKATALLQRIPLPEVAPAIWRDDKQPGDTPPTFIKRHYGAFLRADATGLTKPDIRQLDFSLYTALANWLRNNELPGDCPIPLKWQQVDAQLQAVSANTVQDIDSREMERLAKARRRRER